MSEVGFFETATDGTHVFRVTGCTECQMDTAGRHQYGCTLYKPARTIIYAPKSDTVEVLNANSDT